MVVNLSLLFAGLWSPQKSCSAPARSNNDESDTLPGGYGWGQWRLLWPSSYLSVLLPHQIHSSLEYGKTSLQSKENSTF